MTLEVRGDANGFSLWYTTTDKAVRMGEVPPEFVDALWNGVREGKLDFTGVGGLDAAQKMLDAVAKVNNRCDNLDARLREIDQKFDECQWKYEHNDKMILGCLTWRFMHDNKSHKFVEVNVENTNA